MATLVSPGASVSIVNESQYSSTSALDSIPLIILATHQDKATPDGISIADNTTKAEAGELKLITSPRELAQSYGNPIYYDLNGTTQQANELNEVGLLSAYKTLNVSNRVYVLRADIDLNDLKPSATAPASNPDNGTYWLDIDETEYGIFVYTEGNWVNQSVNTLNDEYNVTGAAPESSVGANGDYAVLVKNDANTTGEITYYQKLNNAWKKLGSADWDAATPTVGRATTSYSSASSQIIATLPIAGETIIIDVDASGSPITVTMNTIVNATATLNTSNTLALKTVSLNGITVTLGTSSGAGIANATYASDTAAVSGLTIGDIMRVTDTAGVDDITMAITVLGQGLSLTGDIGGTIVINGASIALTNEANVAALVATIDAVIGSGGTNDQGFTVADDGGEVQLVKNRVIVGENNANTIVIDVSAVTTGGTDATGFSTGTTNMSIQEVATSVAAGVSNTNNITGAVSGAGPYTLTIADSATGLQIANLSGTPVTDLALPASSAVPIADIETEIEAATTNIEVDDTAGNDIPVTGQKLRLTASSGAFVIAAGTANVELGLTEGTYYVSLNSLVSQFNADSGVISFGNTTASIDTNNGANFVVITNTASKLITLAGTAASRLGFPATISISSLYFATHTNVPSGPEEGDVWIKTTTPNLGANYIVKYWSGQWFEIDAPLYADNNAAFDGFGTDITTGSLFVRYDKDAANEADFKIRRFNGNETLTLTEGNFTVSPGSTIQISNGRAALASVSVTDIATFVAAINSLGQANLSAATSANGVEITNATGEDIVLADGTAAISTVLPGLSGAATYSNWAPLYTSGYVAQENAPSGASSEGTLWFDDSVNIADIDLLVNDDGLDQWVTFTGDVQLSATRPSTRTDATSLQAKDIWINTNDLDNYPYMFRWDTTTGGKWIVINKSDQTTEFGIIFSDARVDATSNLDPDAPNPLLYPAGMLLWNTRASSMIVKEYRADWFSDDTATGENWADTDYTQTTYTVGNDTYAALASDARWVTVSGNETDGTAYMGRKAQRIMIINALGAAVTANEDVRDIKSFYFNLMLTPGYPEMIDEMVTLNVDRKETAFIISDTPARLANAGTSLQSWATNQAGATSTGDEGLTTKYDYAANYYPPLGLTKNLDGTEVAAPSSLGALYAFLYNDSVAYPWMAPAGVNRGLLSGIFSSVGNINAEDEYKTVNVNQGLSDVLYTNSINPIVTSNTRGLYVNGQKTLSPTTSALDRVNVARLIVYLRYALEQLAEEFLHTNNTQTTQNNVQDTYSRALADLMSQGALYDYLVVCDASNNTPERIDRNELWIDIAIQPVKNIEFIYIPVRIKNTGEDLTA